MPKFKKTCWGNMVMPCNYLRSLAVVIRQYDITKIIPCFFLGISCQKHNLKSIHADYIYRIISSKKQKGKPYEMDLPSWKTISQPLKQLQNSRYIADRTGFDLGISKRNPNYI